MGQSGGGGCEHHDFLNMGKEVPIHGLTCTLIYWRIHYWALYEFQGCTRTEQRDPVPPAPMEAAVWRRDDNKAHPSTTVFGGPGDRSRLGQSGKMSRKSDFRRRPGSSERSCQGGNEGAPTIQSREDLWGLSPLRFFILLCRSITRALGTEA